MSPDYPALIGFVQQLPARGESWTPDRRDEWLAAFRLVLDFCVPLVSGDDQDGTPPAEA